MLPTEISFLVSLLCAAVGVDSYPVERRKFMLYSPRSNVVLTGKTGFTEDSDTSQLRFREVYLMVLCL